MRPWFCHHSRRFPKWLVAKARSVAESTRDPYRSVITKFLIFLNDQVNENPIYFTTRQITTFGDDNAARLASSYTNKRFKILGIIFPDTWRDNVVDTNVADKVANVKARKANVHRPFTLM